MPRKKLVDGVEMPLTVAEEARRDAEDAQWAAELPTRSKARTVSEKRGKAVDDFLDAKMAEFASDPSAPQSVKDWDTEKRRP